MSHQHDPLINEVEGAESSPVSVPPSTPLITTPAAAVSVGLVGSQLGAGGQLNAGDWLVSPNHVYTFAMQTDANLVLYGPGGPLWASHTSGTSGAYLANQFDGNLVIYSPNGVLWDSRTEGRGPATLVVQDDGNVVLYGPGGPIWSTGTAGGVSKLAASGAVAFARRQLGKPYVWGATGPDAYDCSGLTQACYASVGIPLNRTAAQQFRQGVAVERNSLQPGDLVFYNNSTNPTHVGIYVGNDQIINALNPSTGVRYDHITYPGTLVGYRRIA